MTPKTPMHTHPCSTHLRRTRSLFVAASLSLVSTLLLVGGAHAFAGSIAVGLGRLNEVGEVKTSFVSDATLETEALSVNTRIHYKPGKVRDELEIGGRDVVTIRRFDLDKVWIIMGHGMYMEMDADADSEQAPDYKLVSREIVGPDIVNGMETTKYKSIYETKDGKFGGFTWYTDDHIAVKAFLVHESQGEKIRVKFEMTNLERGEQPDSLFEVPKGYRALDMGNIPGMPNIGSLGGASGGFGKPPSK
jgi:hypothetical protein